MPSTCSSACNPAATALGRFLSPPHCELYNSLAHVFSALNMYAFPRLALAFSFALPTTFPRSHLALLVFTCFLTVFCLRLLSRASLVPSPILHFSLLYNASRFV